MSTFSTSLTPTPVAGKAIPYTYFTVLLDNTLALQHGDQAVDLLKVDQGAGDAAVVRLISSDIAHGMTDFAPTSDYGTLQKASATDGGVELRGFSETTTAAKISGFCTTGDTVKSVAANGYVAIVGVKKSGTGVAAPAANENLLVVLASGNTRFILDADGDSHQDVGTAWTNFDRFDDPALLTALSVAVSQPGDPLRHGFAEFLDRHRAALELARLVEFNDDGHHFVNMSRLTMLLVGAVRQIAADVQRLQEPWYRRAWRSLTGRRLLLPA